MAAYAFETPSEKAVSGALALVMHALFLALLVFSVSWQKREHAAMVVELWSSLPAPKVEVAPPPPKVEPEPPKPQPKVEVKPPPKADIELREKKERERKAREQALAEKKKREERERAEALRQQRAKEAAEAKRREQERAKEAAEAKRREQEQAEALRKAAQEQAAAQAREIDKYRQAIAARIKRFIVEPPNVQGNPVAELRITTLPGGEVLDVTTRKSSGQAAWDNACERAIRRAQPLPLPPPDSPIFKEFRELTHACRYKE